MTNIVSHLNNDLKNYIESAEEIYIAVALMDEYGLSMIKNTSKDCKVSLLLGIDLPTSSDVLEELLELPFETNIYIDKQKFFHSKMYLFKTTDSYIGFVGSGNFTKAGLSENIELAWRIENQEECSSLKDWFDKIKSDSIPLNKDFLKKYKNITREKDNVEIQNITDLKDKYKNIIDKELKVWSARRIKNSDNSCYICIQVGEPFNPDNVSFINLSTYTKNLFDNNPIHQETFKQIDKIMHNSEYRDRWITETNKSDWRDLESSLIPLPSEYIISGYIGAITPPKGKIYKWKYGNKMKSYALACIGEKPTIDKEGNVVKEGWGETPESLLDEMITRGYLFIENIEENR